MQVNLNGATPDPILSQKNNESPAQASQAAPGNSDDTATLSLGQDQTGALVSQTMATPDMRLDKIGDGFEPRVERLRLGRLHKAQMAFWQRDLVIARQRADDRDPRCLDRLDDEPAMALAADAIDDDAGDAEPPVIAR